MKSMRKDNGKQAAGFGKFCGATRIIWLAGPHSNRLSSKNDPIYSLDFVLGMWVGPVHLINCRTNRIDPSSE